MATLPEHVLGLLVCPGCGASGLARSEERLLCPACGAGYPVVRGVIDLRREHAPETELERIDYDAVHGIDGQAARNVHRDWLRVLQEQGAVGGSVLEVGAGTGVLTHGLATSRGFREVHVTDVSVAFLERLRSRLGSVATAPVHYYACDANALPFRGEGIDLVVGRSILHHLLDYAETLRSCHALLAPGGIAVFYEPVLQGKVHVAFLLDLMFRLNNRLELGIFDADETKRLQAQVVHQTKSGRYEQTREWLAGLEDKYIFDIERMRELGRRLGFRSVAFRNGGGAEHIRSYRPYVEAHLRLAGIPLAKADRLGLLHEAFENTWGTALADRLVTPMGYFVFRK